MNLFSQEAGLEDQDEEQMYPFTHHSFPQQIFFDHQQQLTPNAGQSMYPVVGNFPPSRPYVPQMQHPGIPSYQKYPIQHSYQQQYTYYHQQPHNIFASEATHMPAQHIMAPQQLSQSSVASPVGAPDGGSASFTSAAQKPRQTLSAAAAAATAPSVFDDPAQYVKREKKILSLVDKNGKPLDISTIKKIEAPAPVFAPKIKRAAKTSVKTLKSTTQTAVISPSPMKKLLLNCSTLKPKIQDVLENDFESGLDNDELNLNKLKIMDNMIPELCQCLNLFGNQIKYLSLQHNKISSKSFGVLITWLKHCKSNIKRIHLEKNQLDDNCMAQLGDFIRGNKIIEIVGIGNNKITDRGIKILSELVSNCPNFNTIWLQGHKGITDNSFPYLIDMISKTNLTTIILQKTSLSEGACDEIKRELHLPPEKRRFEASNFQSVLNGSSSKARAKNDDSTSSNSLSSSKLDISKTFRIKSNQCELLEDIDSGRFSNIYKMGMRRKDGSGQDLFAFKQFRISFNSIKDEELKMIKNEIDMLGHLKHPNIVEVKGVIDDPNARDIKNERMGIGIVMEYCENGSLRSLLNKNANNNQHQQLLNMNLIIRLLLGAAQGLEFLHYHEPNSVIHGDIKSDNILIDKEYNAKLCDFGLSKLHQTATASSARGGNGTIAYNAPETFDQKVDTKSDVYSFGCVILEMLTGERPWNVLGNDIGKIYVKVVANKEQHDLSKVRKDASEELIDLMKRCLDYDKDKRPKMNDVTATLKHINALMIREETSSKMMIKAFRESDLFDERKFGRSRADAESEVKEYVLDLVYQFGKDNPKDWREKLIIYAQMRRSQMENGYYNPSWQRKKEHKAYCVIIHMYHSKDDIILNSELHASKNPESISQYAIDQKNSFHAKNGRIIYSNKDLRSIQAEAGEEGKLMELLKTDLTHIALFEEDNTEKWRQKKR